MERKDPGLSSPISDLRTAFRVKEEEQIISLCGEAERALKVLEGLTPEELASELPALLLRFRRLKASFEKAVCISISSGGERTQKSIGTYSAFAVGEDWDQP